jgi:hypothetical protein
VKPYLRHPAAILAALAVVSATLGTYVQGPGYGDAPLPGLYMTLTGLWFGLVIGLGIWRWGSRSWVAAATALLATWAAWELAVNVAIQLEERWLKITPIPDALTIYVSGFAAGAVGAFATWAGAAIVTPVLRRAFVPVSFVAAGALLGLLLPCINYYDDAAVLLLPWETAIAAILGIGLSRGPLLVPAQELRDRA